MRFASPLFLWLLLFIPLGAAYLILFRPDDLPTFRLSSFRLLGDNGRSVRKSGVFVSGWFRLVALTLVILALARPQRGLRSEELTTKVTDIMICLDASRSMLTIDFKPQDRFQVSKEVISEFIKGREYDRIGMTLFAEHAITICPLTTDRSALLNILDRVQVGAIPQDQTAIGVGIATTVNRLKDSQAKSKVIVLLTDGSNNAGNVDPITAAKSAEAFGIKVYAIGAGTTEGGLMPVDDPNFGRRMVAVKSDLDEELLMKVATQSHGKYFRAKSADALKNIFREIDELEKTDVKVNKYVDYEERYVWLLVVAALALFTELLLNKVIFRTVP